MTIIDIAAGIILAAQILGWFEQRARAQYQERMWKAEEVIQERHEQAQRDEANYYKSRLARFPSLSHLTVEVTHES